MVKLVAAIMASVLGLLGLTYLLIVLNWIDADRLHLLPPLIALLIAAEIGIYLIRQRHAKDSSGG
ncbi:hypothetical protein [Caballeronia sp. KNU42]